MRAFKGTWWHGSFSLGRIDAVVSLAHAGWSSASERNYILEEKTGKKKVRNQYLEVVERPTPTPSCVTANPIAPRDKMLSNVTIDCCLR